MKKWISNLKLLIILIKGEDNIMVNLFATLIINGRRTIDECPKLLVPEIKKVLEEAGVADIVL